MLHAAGPLQLCVGQPAGCEAAICAIRKACDSSDTEAVLKVDATNAFNCLNHQTTLKNISALCPSFARILSNTFVRIPGFVLMVTIYFPKRAQPRKIHWQCQCML